jgi:hypothetical protein
MTCPSQRWTCCARHLLVWTLMRTGFHLSLVSCFSNLNTQWNKEILTASLFRRICISDLQAVCETVKYKSAKGELVSRLRVSCRGLFASPPSHPFSGAHIMIRKLASFDLAISSLSRYAWLCLPPLLPLARLPCPCVQTDLLTSQVTLSSFLLARLERMRGSLETYTYQENG